MFDREEQWLISGLGLFRVILAEMDNCLHKFTAYNTVDPQPYARLDFGGDLYGVVIPLAETVPQGLFQFRGCYISLYLLRYLSLSG